MENEVLQTERLIMRPWRESDAEALYEYASDPRIGPAAGWPPHESVEESRRIIREVLACAETYALVLKGQERPIGCISLVIGEKGGHNMGPKGAEIGYWVGVPFWGQGLVPEAVTKLLHRSFDELGLETIWCGYYDGNEKSRRVQEKCGFSYHHTKLGTFCPLVNETRTEHLSCITKEQWQGLTAGTV